jgi:hypothetical protein
VRGPTREESSVPHPARLLAAGAASLLLLAAVPAQADETTATAEPTASAQATASTTAAHPGAPGNNGTVKIADGTDLDEERPENDPHVPCTFAVEWFGYDSGWGPLTAQVDLQLQAPTDEAAGVAMAAEGDRTPTFTGNGGRPGAGDGRDHLEWYTLSFTGEPHPQQGYHVKVTVDTPHSKGSTTKSKVFWVGPCAEDEAAPVTPSSPVVPSAGAPSSDEDTTTPAATSPTPAPTASTSDASGAPASVLPSESTDIRASGTPTVLGTEAVVPVAGGDAPSDEPTVLGVEAQAAAGVAAPTAVAAGLPGVLRAVHAKATSPAGAVLVTVGLLLVGTAVAAAARRRRGTHQY